ncbi:MAG TPA: hypothetical protein VHO01_02110 [Jatrophihabitans sp.]|nr:hypothetical protein [Jatrophihabitans sp.]
MCGETGNPGGIFCRNCGAELPRRGVGVPDAQTTVLPKVAGAGGEPPDAAAQRTAHLPPPPDAGWQQPYPPAGEQQVAGYPAGEQPTEQQLPAYLQPRTTQAGYQGPLAGYPDEPPPLPLPVRDGPPGRPNNRGVILATVIGGVLALVLIAFGLAIFLLSQGNSTHKTAQPPIVASSSAATTAPASSTPATSPSPTTSPTPADATLKAAQLTALKQLAGLVSQSGTARSGIQTALDQIGSCKSINQAIGTLTQAADTRNGLSGSVSKLNLAAIPTAPQLVASFQQSMQESAAADTGYANWGRQVSRSCKKTAPHTSAWRDAQVHDGRATAAKTTFANQYNAVARALGQPGITPAQF